MNPLIILMLVIGVIAVLDKKETEPTKPAEVKRNGRVRKNVPNRTRRRANHRLDSNGANVHRSGVNSETPEERTPEGNGDTRNDRTPGKGVSTETTAQTPEVTQQ